MRIEKRIVITQMARPATAAPMRMEMRHGGGHERVAAGCSTWPTPTRTAAITLAEATERALQHFDKMDANRDGKRHPEERAPAAPR